MQTTPTICLFPIETRFFMATTAQSSKKRRAPNLSATPAPKRPRKAATTAAAATPKESKLKFKSPAEFFAENKNIAGFDNPGKSLYTTIRELVENGLDAAEAISTLPDITVHVERINRSAFSALVGIHARDRVDQSLYKDVETDKERKAREKKEARRKKNRPDDATVPPESQSQPNSSLQLSQIASQQASASAPAQQQDPIPAVQEKRRTGGNEIFRVTVTDNGSGMPHDDVPNMMGRVLAGTKYCVRQARGKFGLGSKMALIWSKMSTGLPVEITTSDSEDHITYCILDIDISKNVPTIQKHERRENSSNWHGTKVTVIIEGNWTTYRAKILQYMRQMAVITPYAKLDLKFDAGTEGDSRDLQMIFARRTDIMPSHAIEVKHHPSSVNQLILKQIIGNVRPSTSLVRFLSKEFESIPSSLATRLITELGPEFTSHMTVGELSLNHIRQIDTLLHEARFAKPNGKCLSPAGEYNLRLGITKELRPTLVATHAEPADVFEGHPFVVEAGVALGGSGMKPGINIYRFANRIPLLFEAGNDVVSKTAREDIRWANYKMSTTADRIGVICSIVSTKIPFKGTGKEYIGDDSDTIKVCVKRAITQCCSQLKTKLVRRMAQKDAADRKKNIAKYAPDVANAIVGVLDEVEDAEPDTADVVKQVQDGELTKEMLLAKLIEHVQQIDKEQAIEYAAATGRDQQTVETIFASRRQAEDEYLQVTVTGTGNPVVATGAGSGSQTSQLAFPFRLALQKGLSSSL